MKNFKFTQDQLEEMIQCITLCELSFEEAMRYIEEYYEEIKTPLDENNQEA